MPSPSSSLERTALSVSLAVGAYGTAFGAAAVAAGLSPLQASVLSLAAFTGSSQFAAVAVVASGAGRRAPSARLRYSARVTVSTRCDCRRCSTCAVGDASPEPW
jgi:hypothetical protein